MSRNVGEWIVPVNERDGVRYSYRGGSKRFKKLKSAFDRFQDLEERVLESPLGAMYRAMEHFRYSSPVVYNMLVRSVTSDAEDHLLFRFKDTICRLGRPEFALISGLSFLPTDVDRRSIEEIGPSSLIEHRDPTTGVYSGGPFHINVDHIRIQDIEEKLVDEESAENVYKLGLVYLIDAVMYGKASGKFVSSFVFNLVDDTAQFLAYPWGAYFWDVSLFEWNKRIDLLTKPPGKKCKKKKVNKKNTWKKCKKNTEDELEEEGLPADDIHGLVPVLVAWGCESLPTDVVEKIAVRNNNDVPRILRWRSVTSRIYFNPMTDVFNDMTGDVIRHLVPIDDEVMLLTANGLTEDEISTAPNTYPVPVDAPSQPAPTPTILQPIDTDVATASQAQAAPTQSSDDGNESVYLRAVSEMRAEMKQLISDVMVAVHETREHVDKQVDFIREEIKGLKEEHSKDIRELGVGVAQQINFVSDGMVTIRNVINQLQVSMGGNVDSPPPPPPPPPPPSSSHAGNARQTHNYEQYEHQHHHHQEKQADIDTFRNEQGHAEQLHEPTTSIDLILEPLQNTQYYVPNYSTLRDDFCMNFNDTWSAATAVEEATSLAAVRDVKHDERPAHVGDKGDALTAISVKEATSSAGDVRGGKLHVRDGDNCDVPPPKRKTILNTKQKIKTNITGREVRDTIPVRHSK